MPGYDGTGPVGKGPLTGRGAGSCAGAEPNSRRPYGLGGFLQRPFGGLFGWFGRASRMGRGGRGAGRGAGRGRRRR